jgi:SRSO17 transposase
MNDAQKEPLTFAARWGLSLSEIEGLGQRLVDYWAAYGWLVCTKTRDTRGYGFGYLSGLLRMEDKRTLANIGRQVGVTEQNMQHFISVSPWSGRRMIKEVTDNLAVHPYFAQESVLLLDESADAKVGKVSAGVGRQYNGRLGKVDNCQVGVFLAITNNGLNCWIDGELFIPEHWFAADQAAVRKRLGIPTERVFATKVELGWQMIERAQAQGIPFAAVACDEFYGRSATLRNRLGASWARVLRRHPREHARLPQ